MDRPTSGCTDGVVSRWGRACGKTRSNETERESRLLGFGLCVYLSHGRLAMAHERVINGLMTEMADRAIRVGRTRVVVPDTPHRHRQHEGCQESDWD